MKPFMCPFCNLTPLYVIVLIYFISFYWLLLAEPAPHLNRLNLLHFSLCYEVSNVSAYGTDLGLG